ncbi:MULTISPECIES: ATP-binding protein [unclassified Hydrotalea]|uniref:ATP-binding protein n=1 Tax=unclassified Hydrotalea TaxID=2643788 RepID=UPI000B26880F|nr:MULTISPECIES: ATP-binding protein [unclassified Hydrotalea]
MEQKNIKKIVVIGPESTGKTTLCQNLAHHFNTLWVPEFAREYLEVHGKEYTLDDLEKIAAGQLALEDEITLKLQTQLPKASCLLIDTDMYVMKVWSEYVFGQCSPFILEAIAERSYDLYLLCDVDVPWVKDDLREYPDEGPRIELFAIYKDILIHQQTPWQIISGSYAERTEKAIQAVRSIL